MGGREEGEEEGDGGKREEKRKAAMEREGTVDSLSLYLSLSLPASRLIHDPSCLPSFPPLQPLVLLPLVVVSSFGASVGLPAALA